MIIHGSRWLPTSIDKAAAAALGLVALLAGAFACAPVKSADMEAARPLIHLDDTGKLVYVPDEKGNVIPDFSNAGYGGGPVSRSPTSRSRPWSGRAPAPTASESRRPSTGCHGWSPTPTATGAPCCSEEANTR